MITKAEVLEKLSDDFSSNKERYLKKFDEFRTKYWQRSDNISDMQMAISGQLFVEKEINTVLSIIFKDDSKFKRFTYNQKIKIIEATGIYPPNVLKNLYAIGSMRNKFAHDLDYVPSYEDVKKLRNILKQNEWEKSPGIELRTSVSYTCGYASAMVHAAQALKDADLIKL